MPDEHHLPQPGSRPDLADFRTGFDRIRDNVSRAIRGKQDVVRLALVAFVAEGHVLLEDVPGVGKTMLAKSIARTAGCSWRRIQFTPDLLPTDVTGVSVWDRGSGDFEFKPGAVFSNICLGDEINRASPKTQSALLESMEERQVTVDGVTHKLPEPFMVIATQNPVEHEGTYPLPESQLDRFMMRLSMGYPDRAAELEILARHGNHSVYDDLEPVTDAAGISVLVKMAHEVHVASSIQSYIVDLCEATRDHPDVYLGASPRASLFLLRAARVIAASHGRGHVLPDDLRELVQPVLAHRVLVTPEAQMRGLSSESVLEDLMRQVPLPVASP